MDFHWLVIGSGFGGSVSALRLAQKGYSVGLLEAGRRFADDELPASAWDARRYARSATRTCSSATAPRCPPTSASTRASRSRRSPSTR